MVAGKRVWKHKGSGNIQAGTRNKDKVRKQDPGHMKPAAKKQYQRSKQA